MLIDGSVILCMGNFLRQEHDAIIAHDDDGEGIDDIFAVELAGLNALRHFCDSSTCAHAQRLVSLAGSVGAYLRLTPVELFDLRMSALLHDIGKVAIPASILQKSEPLNASELNCIRLHSQLGQRILLLAGDHFAPFAPVVVTHHESWDGSGYPWGLCGDEIPLLARILTVVDAYDAMVSYRTYGTPRSIPQAHQELMRCVGYQFDPRIVDAFLTVFGAEQSSDAYESPMPAMDLMQNLLIDGPARAGAAF